jgi:hypothetical protein
MIITENLFNSFFLLDLSGSFFFLRVVTCPYIHTTVGYKAQHVDTRPEHSGNNKLTRRYTQRTSNKTEKKQIGP